MLFTELKASLRNKVAPIYMLFGSDVFLINKSIELIIAAYGGGADVSRTCEDVGSSEVVAKCRTISMFSDKRVVIVRGVSDKFFDKELINYLSKPDESCVLILTSENSINVKNIQPVNCNPMDEATVVKLIGNQVASSGKKITAQAAELLARFCANNYAQINNEITKLVNYLCEKEMITADDVSEISYKTEEYQIYELSNAVLKKDIEKSQVILEQLLKSGVDEYAIFGAIVAAAKRCFYALRTKSPDEVVAAALKCNPYAIKATRRDYKPLTDKIVHMYRSMLDLEYKIKSGSISTFNAIILCCGLV